MTKLYKSPKSKDTKTIDHNTDPKNQGLNSYLKNLENGCKVVQSFN